MFLAHLTLVPGRSSQQDNISIDHSYGSLIKLADEKKVIALFPERNNQKSHFLLKFIDLLVIASSLKTIGAIIVYLKF